MTIAIERMPRRLNWPPELPVMKWGWVLPTLNPGPVALALCTATPLDRPG